MNTIKRIACLTLFFIGITALAGAEEGLIARWTFDADPPGQIKNACGDMFHASSDREFPRVEGVFGNAIELSGQFRLNVPKEVVPADLQELTFSAWVVPKAMSRYREIFRKEDGDRRLLFSFQDDGQHLALGLNIDGVYDECDAVIVAEEVMDGDWHFVAATFDGRCKRVYLDGVEIGSSERRGKLVAGGNAPGFIGSSSGTSEFFEGTMDDLRFYRRALPAEEIQQLYTEGIKTLASSGDAQKAQAKALALYSKGATFRETLVATRNNVATNVAASGSLEPREIAALTRLLRSDFADDMNRYRMKWQHHPVEVMLFSSDQLQQYFQQLETAYFEYMPLTDSQWKYLSPADLDKWNRAKEYKKVYEERLRTGGNDNGALLYEIVCEMELTIEPRPMQSEPVAPYITPSTPPVQNRSAGEAMVCLENEWMHQCDGNPTVARSLEEIGWARKLAKRLSSEHPTLEFDNELQQLDALEAMARVAAGVAAGVDRDLYFAVRTVKREITFKNPAIDFDSILFVDGPFPQGREWNHETRHRLGYMAVPGGRLMTMQGLHPGGKQTKLMPTEPLHGSFWRPDLSYDGTKVLVSFKPHNEKNFHLYEINIDGSGQRQLTAGIFDDLDPIYLPDGRHIMFLTTRGYLYVRCMPPTNAFVMARMAIDGSEGEKNLYIISRNGEPEYTPSVMSDGRVIYTRWEYTDKPLWRAQGLWTMNADGTQVQTFWGNQSVWPDLLKDARSIPGSRRIMFTGSAHHDIFAGCIGIIDPARGFNFPDGLTKVTQELIWPESGNGPIDPKETDEYHTAGAYTAYYSPYPLNEKDFLVSARRVRRNAEGRPYHEKFVLFLMDVNGNRELIHEGVHHIFDAMPIRARAIPRVLPEMVNWPTWENRDKPGTGVIYSSNVYENTSEELKNRAKYLRIWSVDHKTYTYWYKRPYASSGPEVSMNQSDGVKKIIGTVPIEDDGSVSFHAPSGIALHFQLLDENQRALQTMRSFTGVQPGESRGCVGCHESMTRSPVAATSGKALRRTPSDITPVPWDDLSVSYERYVQPVLDKYCGECHQNPEHEAYQQFNMTLRPGFVSFKEPYVTLLGRPTWGAPYNAPKDPPPGFGWADTMMVEGFDQRDPVAYTTFAPMTKLSYKSRLVNRMASGEHHGITVDPESLLRVILWVDAMGPFLGTEEIRQIPDPVFQGKDWLSQPPRIRTAPIVQRPGPFDPFFPDSAYDCPDDSCLNALPFGVERK